MKANHNLQTKLKKVQDYIIMEIEFDLIYNILFINFELDILLPFASEVSHSLTC